MLGCRCGTGSVSVELALHSQAVWAIEHKAEACELIRCNREKFCAWNLRVVEGHAPEALHELPAPDVVFLGGTDRKMPEILQFVREKNPKARVCSSACAGDPAPGRGGTDRPGSRPGDHPNFRKPRQGGGGPAPAPGPKPHLFALCRR